jgi:HK97 family phage major capsid protein
MGREVPARCAAGGAELSRRYVNPNRSVDAWERAAADLEATYQQQDAQARLAAWERLGGDLAALMGPGRGRIRSAGRRLAAVPDYDRPEPIGAKLDGYKWASSFSAFLSAIKDKDDKQGARAAIQRVQDSRPKVQNAAGMSERIPYEGGHLVPERLRVQILSYLQHGIVRPRAQIIPMDSLRVPVPILDNPTQASSTQALGGLAFAFTEEGAGITPSTPSFGAVTLEARKAAAYMVGVPNEMLADATPFTEIFLPQTVGKGLSWFLDDMAIYTGTGVGEPQSLANAPGAVTVTRNTSSKVLHTDVVAMLKQLHPASKTKATWLCSEDVWDQLLTVYYTVGSAPSGQDISPPGVLLFDNGRWELFGLEIIPNDHQPAVGTQGDLMLADLDLLLLGMRDEMTIEISGKGTGFISDTSNIRIKQRIDSRYWIQQSVTLENGKVVSPLVVLQ